MENDDSENMRKKGLAEGKVQIKFFVKIENNEETHLLIEESKFEELFEKIKVKHPNKQDYWIKIMWNDVQDNKLLVKNEYDHKDKGSFISKSLPSIVKDYENLSKIQNSTIDCHVSAEFIIKPKLNIHVYLEKPTDDFLPMIKGMCKKENYTRDPVFNVSSSHSKLTREEGEILIIIADDTKIKEIVSEEINTMSRLIVISKTYDEKTFQKTNPNIPILKVPDPSKLKTMAIAYFSTKEIAKKK